MSTSTQRWIFAGLLAVVAVAWAFSGALFDRGGRSERQVARPEAPVYPAGQTENGPVRTGLVQPVLEVGSRGGEGSIFTTVLWPLEIDLQLVRANHRPSAEGVPESGSGADATLKGRISRGEGESVSGARITFLEGANAGRSLMATASGEFGASDLYPGLSIVEVRGPGLLGARREVRLRARKETLFNVPFGRPGAVFGQVFDHAGAPLPNAEVLFDGLKVFSDADGTFYVAQVAGGPCLVEVRAEGHAALREVVNVASGRVMERDRVKFRLQKACSLALVVNDRIGGPEPVQVTLLPSDDRASRTFPWYAVNPVEVVPGVPTHLDGLPSGSVRVLGFRSGAICAERVANLRPERETSVEIGLSAAPKLTGKVVRDGEPVAGALVRMEAPDRVQATLSYHRKPSYFLETEVMEHPAPALQETYTDSSGHFELTAWDDVSPVRYIEVWGPANAAWAGRVVRRGDKELELELKDVSFGRATLELDVVGRHMGLPVEVTVNGQPHAELVVPSDAPLRIDSLVEGTWKLSARWQATVVQPEILLELEEEQSRALPTIPEIIEGQTAEQWRRAGREWPGPPE